MTRPGRLGVVLAAFLALAWPAAAAAAPTFGSDVAPILYTHCVRCHQPGGAAPFPLVRYRDARQRARQIAEVTRRGLMPPWQADANGHEFVGQTRLSPAQIATLEAWAASGASEGPAPAAAPRLTAGWQLGPPDLVVTLPDPFMLPADGADLFRIFVLPLPVEIRRFVRGLEFHPGDAAVVHHVNIRLDRTPASRARDREDPAPGYDGLLTRTAVFPDGHFLGWTPGQTAPLLPDGLAWALEPGTDLVLQAHMQPNGRPAAVQPAVGLYFTEVAPTHRLSMLRLGRQDLDIPPGEAAYTVSDRFTLPVGVDLHALQPHAHYRAREIVGDATLPDGRLVPLIHIRDWNFRWQHLYRFAAPPFLPAGTTVSMRYTYDNSAANPRNPSQPPVRAPWGQRSFEEMGDLWLQVEARSADDLAALNRAFRPKAVREDLVGYESLIRRAPDDVGLHDDAAVLYLELGDFAAAAAHWREGVRLQPTVPSAHFNLASTLALAGDRAAARVSLERALQLDDRYARAHTGLGRLLLVDGEAAAALPHLRAAIALAPDDADAHYQFGLAERALGRPESAVAAWRRATTLAPGWVAPAIDLAWQLATRSSATAGDRRDAVALATRAVTLTARGDAAVLDVLAVALAADGQFDRAVTIADEALAIAHDAALARAIARRRALFAQQQRFAY